VQFRRCVASARRALRDGGELDVQVPWSDAVDDLGAEPVGGEADGLLEAGCISRDRSGFEKPARAGRRSLPLMKTMTCKQLGGPCDVAHHGKDHNEVILAQDRHLKAQITAGDETHREAHEGMRGRWKRPISGLGWYRDVKRRFARLPDDA
jgi:hypothetical protein